MHPCHKLPAEAMFPDEQLRKGVLEMKTEKGNVTATALIWNAS